MDNLIDPMKSFEPCIHAEPQADSCLHGVCIFCYRDRLGRTTKQCNELAAALCHMVTQENLACNAIHHEKVDRHKANEFCPIINRYRSLLDTFILKRTKKES
jgi:hypothetical protein